MSHSDTIRRAITGHLTKVEDDTALAALDALLADNQRWEDRAWNAERRKAAVEAENQRLRKALRYIAGEDMPGVTPHLPVDLVAREALAGDAE